MTQALIFASLNGFSLIAGALIGIYFQLQQKTIAAVMAFGAGVFICALTFGLMEEAFGHGGFDAIIIGFLAGGLLYLLGDWLIHRWGGRKHKRHQHFSAERGGNGLTIVLGAALDGIPEAIALGIALFSNPALGLMLLTAIVLSNIPEGLSSVNGLKKENFSHQHILVIWISVGIMVALATLFSFIFLPDLNLNTLGILESLAAGAILAMLAGSMMPEAYEEGGYAVSILTIVGFLVTFVISRL